METFTFNATNDALCQHLIAGAVLKRQSAILDNILDAVLAVDGKGQVLEANLAACRTFWNGRSEGLIGAAIDGSDRRVGGGTDLGLYVARLLVERMGGRISLAPQAGSGATIHVRFPPLGVAS